MSGNDTTCHAPPPGTAMLDSRSSLPEMTSSGLLLWAALALVVYCVWEQINFYLKRCGRACRARGVAD